MQLCSWERTALQTLLRKVALAIHAANSAVTLAAPVTAAAAAALCF
jgi:hypothetical protein